MLGVMSLGDDLLLAFELHSPPGIRKCLDKGLSPIKPIDGKPPVEHLIEMYTRSPKFPECVQVLLSAGATIEDPLLQCVLLDDAEGLRTLLEATPDEVHRPLDVTCAYTCCKGVTALHLCAEFNAVECARVLLASGAHKDARAAIDAQGFGGQTPLFHAVNSNLNHSRPVMELLVDVGADLDVRLKGLKWGEGFDWETLLFDVTVFSYAQCGLYRQFHRKEEDIYSNLSYMHERRYGSAAPLRNVPNKYLQS